MARVMVTGATGYVGSAAVRKLSEDGHEVVGVVRDPESRRARMLADEGVALVAADVTRVDTLLPHLGGVDVVLHTVPSESERDDRAFFKALSQQQPSPYVIYVTGCSAFGEHDHEVLREDVPGDGGNLRYRLENVLRSSALRHTVVRPAFVYGGDNRSSLLGRWIAEARTGEGAFFGDPTKTWSWVHVDDLARALVAIVGRRDDLESGLFLLADEAPERAIDTYAACRRAFGDASAVPVGPIGDEDPLYRVFDRDEVIDSSHAREVLDWHPRGLTLAQVIAESVRATPTKS
jgi:nucleoside-diphosphate-sugar epimerase